MPYLAALSEERESEPPSFRREKFISETGLLLYAAANATKASPLLCDHIKDVASALMPYARSELLLTSMRLRPVVASEMAVAHACLTHLGYPDRAFQAELEQIMAAPVASMFERVPWKVIETDWLCRIGQVRLALDLMSAVRDCIVSKGLDALFSRREEVYAFTHALIYLTDFGQNPGPLMRPMSSVIDDADAALAGCLDDDDFDLAAEVLFTWPYLRATWTPTGTFGMLVLARVEEEVGFLPSLSLREDVFLPLDGDRRAHYVAAEAYHTAYVMGLLAAALLAFDWSPEVTIPAVDDTRAAQHFHGLLLKRDPVPQWERHFASLQNNQQEGLASFLAAVGLRRALLQRDFRRLRAILESSLEYGPMITPTVVHAAGLLARLARVDARDSC